MHIVYTAAVLLHCLGNLSRRQGASIVVASALLTRVLPGLRTKYRVLGGRGGDKKCALIQIVSVTCDRDIMEELDETVLNLLEITNLGHV